MKAKIFLLFCLAGLLTGVFVTSASAISSGSLTSQTDLPPTGFSTLIADSFDSNQYNWLVGDENYQNQSGNFQIINGQYRWWIQSLKSYAGYFQIPQMASLTDFYISVEVEQVEGAEIAAQGIKFRIDRDWNSYAFIICARCGQFFVYKIVDGETYELTDWTSSAWIKPDDVNRLAILAQGATFQFYINGVLVQTITDSAIEYGTIGLYGAVYEQNDQAVLTFDQFEVWTQAEVVDPLATPSPDVPAEIPDGWSALITETYDTNRNNWQVGRENDEYLEGTWEISAGKYEWRGKAISDLVHHNWLAIGSVRDFYLTAEIQSISTTAYIAYGLVFRNDADGNFYLYVIDSDNNFSVFLFKNGNWTPLIDWTFSALIRPQAANTLAVLAQGPQFQFFINGKRVGEVTNAQIQHGKVGLGFELFQAGDQAVIQFDNVEFYLPDLEIPVWTPFYSSTFDTKDQWYTGSQHFDAMDINLDLVQGSYQWDLFSAEDLFYHVIGQVGTPGDFQLSVDLLPTGGSSNTSSGLVFRNNTAGNYYAFEINQQQEFSVHLNYDNQWFTLIDWTRSLAIDRTGPNQILVWAEQSIFRFFINGEFVGELQDERLPYGDVGLCIEMYTAGSTASFAFDNFILSMPTGPEALLIEGQQLFQLGDHQGAKEKYQQAVALFQQDANPIGEAQGLRSIGLAFWDLYEYDLALAYLEQSLQIFQDQDDVNSTAGLLDQLSRLCMNKDDLNQAIDYSTQAAVLWLALGKDWAAAESIHRIGIAEYYQAEFEQSIAHYQQALNLREPDNDIDISRGLNNIGGVYATLGDYGLAMQYFDQALALVAAIDDAFRQAIYLGNIGITLKDMGEVAGSLDYFQRAETLFLSLGENSGFNVDYYRAVNLSELGVTYAQLDDYVNAQHHLELALVLILENHSLSGEAKVYYDFGELNYLQANYDEALVYYYQALAIQQEIGVRYEAALTQLAIGKTLEALNRPEDALEQYLQSIEGFESIVSTVQAESLKMSFSETSAEVYQRAVRLLFAQGQIEQAFAFSERNRARVFLDSMNRKRPDLQQMSDAALIEEETVLRGEISALETELQEQKSAPTAEQDPAIIELILARLAEKQQAYRDLLVKIQLANPELASLITIPETTIESTQALLDDQTTLISYYLTDATALAFVLTNSEFTVIELPADREQIQAAVESFRTLGMSNLSNPYPRSLIDLHAWLIVPIQEKLHTPYLAIVPHQALHFVPFAALTDGETYLCEAYMLYYLPSAGTLPFVLDKSEREMNTLLVFGDPQTGNPELAGLAYAAREAQKVATLFGTEAFVQGAASEETLYANAGNASVLHLAAHGSFNSFVPIFSRLWLAPSENEDGHLNVFEIYNLDLHNAYLVVLSACQTQLGEISGGDEVVGLYRAFLYGAPTVVASLWSVDDEATGFLMEHFYENLLAGQGKASALQAALAAVRNNPDHPEWAHPYYWAAFVLNGSPGELNAVPDAPDPFESPVEPEVIESSESSKDFSLGLWIGAGVLLGLVSVVVILVLRKISAPIIK